MVDWAAMWRAQNMSENILNQQEKGIIQFDHRWQQYNIYSGFLAFQTRIYIAVGMGGSGRYPTRILARGF